LNRGRTDRVYDLPQPVTDPATNKDTRLADAMTRAPGAGPTCSPGDHARSRKRVLQPNERIAEVLFGLIMVLTFTGSLSVAEAGKQDVRAMLIGALACNLAWGVIDAVLYIMGCFAERANNARRS
jgi:hypothetical protein